MSGSETSEDGLHQRTEGSGSVPATAPPRGPGSRIASAARRAVTGAWRLACGRWSLRACRRGRMVRTRGCPLVEGRGEIRLGDHVSIWSHLARTQLSAGPGARLEVGERTFINTGASISARKLVSIGKRCQIANHVVIMDSDFHGLQDRDRPEPPEAIVIEDDVWLAVRCTVLKGVRIGQGAVVAAGAVVVDDVPAYTLVAGVPARPVRSLRRPAQHA